MKTSAVVISSEVRRGLRDLAKASGKTMRSIAEHALLRAIQEGPRGISCRLAERVLRDVKSENAKRKAGK